MAPLVNDWLFVKNALLFFLAETYTNGGRKLMTIRSSCIAAIFAAIVLSTTAYGAQIGIGITETTVNGGPETLTVTGFAGAIIGGTTDNWTITLPGITLSSSDLPQVWVEKAGDSGFNVLSIISANVLGFRSETASVTTPDNFCGTGTPIQLGVSCFIGRDTAGNTYFAAINEVSTTAAPEPASVLLLATGCIAVGLRFRKRANSSNL